MLATFHLNKLKLNQGFTLLEIVVVLAILALVAGVVMPHTGKVVQRFQAAAERDEVFEQLADLCVQARRIARGFELYQYSAADSSLPLQLPEGWILQAETPIRYRANGFCEGGTVKLQTNDTIFMLNLKPPYCQPIL